MRQFPAKLLWRVLIAAAAAVPLAAAAEPVAALQTTEEAAEDAVRAIPEVAELLERHPGGYLEGGWTGQGWQFEIIDGNQELAVVELDAALAMVEVAIFEVETPDEAAEGQGWARALIPRPTGAAFLWGALALAAALLWPWRGSGPLLVGLLVVWGAAWFLFWRAVPEVELTLWLATLVATALAVAALWTGRWPRLAGEGSAASAPLLALLLAWLLWLVFSGSAVEDSAIWGARGGRYLVDEGAFPYGVLGEGATYGPVQYLLHAPLTLLWPPGEIGVDQFTAARVVAAVAVAALGAAIVFALRFRRARAWAGGAAVLALPWFVAVVDVANVSQLVPVALTAWALAVVVRPTRPAAVIGGALLALGAGAMFVPTFALPALLVVAGWRWRWAAGGAAAVVLAVGVVVLATGTTVGVLWDSTVGFQETAYARAGGLSMWGQNGLEGWRPLGMVLHLLLLAASTVGLVRRPSPAGAFLAAAAAIGGTLLWKGHVGPWGYLTWYVPLLVIGGLLAEDEARVRPAADD